MASTSLEQSLLFELRSPTTPLDTKQHSIIKALAAYPSPSLAALIRDWILDNLLRAIKFTNSTQAELVTSVSWWQLLARVVSDAPAGSASSAPATLPILAHWVGAYAALAVAEVELVRAVTVVWTKLGGVGMRKATADGALDGYGPLVKATAAVVARGGDDLPAWEELVLVWLKTLRVVVDPAKAGKKVPVHTLSLLPTILPLLSSLPPPASSPLASALLETVQYALFNLVNLRRGLARESYNAGTSTSAAAATKDDTEGSAGELLQALRTDMTADPSLTPHVLHALPHFFTLYHSSLATHAATLFPLPAKTSFPTPSAARSALEIHSLQKRRALAASWVRGIAALVGWQDPALGGRAGSMAGTVAEVERADLYREGRENGWEGVLEGVVGGAVRRLREKEGEGEKDGVMSLLGSALRMSFGVVEDALPAVLAALAATAPATSDSASTSVFLSSLLDFHSKSLLLPSLVQLLSTALGTPGALENNLLTSHAFTAALVRQLDTMVASTVPSTWNALVASIEVDLGRGSDAAADEEAAQPSKKRRKVASEGTNPAAAAARLRLLATFAMGLPLPLPLELFASFSREHVQPALKELAKGKAKDEKGVAREVLGVRYAIVERLRRAGEVLEGEEGELAEKRRSGLVEVVRTSGDGATVVEAARTLLQALVPGTSQEVAQPVLAAVLDRITPGNTASWSGLVRGLTADELPVALWELIARRWLVAYELLASDELLARVANLVADNLSTNLDGSITIASITARLLRRADFWELARLQEHVRAAFLARVAIASLSPPSAVLGAVAAAKPPKALRSIAAATVAPVVANFATLTALLPIEYAGRALSNQLIDHAVSLDVWLTAGKVEDVTNDERAGAQEVLRRCVLLALGNRTAALNDAPAVLAHLVRNTTSSAPTLVAVTIELYRHFAQAVAANPEQVQPYLAAVGDEPLKALAKRFKKAVGPLTCEELAFFELCGALAGHLPARQSLPPALAGALEELASGASKAFGKALGCVVAAVAEDVAVVVELADVIRACQAFWQLKDYLSTGAADHDQVELYSTFAQTVLAALLARTTVTDPVKDLAVRQAMLDLLAFRVARLRAVSDKSKVSVLPFETLIACHLAFRQALAGVPGAAAALDGSLKRASVAASLREYEAALGGVTGAVAGAVAGEAGGVVATVATLRPALEVASVLLRDAPEGSSKLAGTCLSDLLRHASLFLIRHGPGTSEATGAGVAEAFLLVARFVEGVCADRPLLLSRHNVGAVLGLVSRMLLPTPGAVDVAVEATSAGTASALFLALTATVSHVVRHHKEHVTQLFPQLVGAIAGLVVVLRRAGYGTTGAAAVLEEGEGDVAAAGAGVASLGRKAEREARETFPFWAWEGGAQGLGRGEAKAVSRLLSSLTTKTASAAPSNKRSAPGADAPKDGQRDKDKDAALASLAAPLSKHAPFLLLAYLRACVHATAPIPSAVRQELQGGWFEVMDCLGKWEREALMKGFLGEGEGAERGVLRGMWKAWEAGRYRG